MSQELKQSANNHSHPKSAYKDPSVYIAGAGGLTAIKLNRDLARVSDKLTAWDDGMKIHADRIMSGKDNMASAIRSILIMKAQ